MTFKESLTARLRLLLVFVNQQCKRRLHNYITDGLALNYAHRDHVVFEDLFFPLSYFCKLAKRNASSQAEKEHE